MDHAGVGDGSKKKMDHADAADGSKKKMDRAGADDGSMKKVVQLRPSVSKRKFEEMGSSDPEKIATTKDFSRKTMKISAVTRAQLKIPFGDTDRVVYCVVTSNTHSAAFCVGHAMFDCVGHRKFTVADHYVKDAVLVAFEDPFDVLLVAGNDIRCGPEALMSVRRVTRIEQCDPDWDGYFQRNIIIAVGPKGEDDDNEDDGGDGGGDAKPDFSCSGGFFATGFGGDGHDGGGAGANISGA